MPISEQRDQQYHNQCVPFEEEDEDNEHGKNSVALEIGKDFLLPDSSLMRMEEEDDDSISPEASSSSSTFLRSDYQSQLHPSDEENSVLLESRRAKNRKAAQKCREKKKEKIRVLENTVKDLNNDIRILKCQNLKLEEEKDQMERVLVKHKKYCSLKIEDESTDSYPSEEQFYPSQGQYSRTPTQHQIYREQVNVPINYSSYMYPAEHFSNND